MLQGRLGFFHVRTYFSCFKVSPSSPHHLSRASKEDAGSVGGGQATCLASPFYRTECLFLGNKACCRAMADESAKTRQHTFYARQRSSEYVPSSA